MQKIKLRELFKKSLEEPNEKWLTIGFFTAFWFFVILGIPFLILGNIVRESVSFSFMWEVGIGGLFLLSVFTLLFVNPLVTLSSNLSILMYLADEKQREKKKLAESTETQ